MEFLIFFIMNALYWLNRERRVHFQKRIGRAVFHNISHAARNIAFMLRTKKLDKIEGDLGRLKNGAVLYSFHFGIWEMMPRALTRLGYRLAIIVNRYSGYNKNLIARLADKLLFMLRSRNGIKVMYRENTREIIRFIKNGGIFGILVDGDTFYAKFHNAEKLARLCKVPLMPFAAYQDKGVGILELGGNIDWSVKKRPLDYWWFYKSRENA